MAFPIAGEVAIVDNHHEKTAKIAVKADGSEIPIMKLFTKASYAPTAFQRLFLEKVGEDYEKSWADLTASRQKQAAIKDRPRQFAIEDAERPSRTEEALGLPVVSMHFAPAGMPALPPPPPPPLGHGGSS